MSSFQVNLITVSRIALIPFIFFLSDELILITCLWVGFSDFLDGFLSRRYNVKTELGAQLDQVADKIFHLAIFAYLLYGGIIDLFFFLLFVLREIAILFLRYFKISSKKSNQYSKMKTALMYLFVIYIFIGKAMCQSLLNEYVITVLEIAILFISYTSLFLSFNGAHSKNN